MASLLSTVKVNTEILALSALAAGETFHMGSACMPSFFTAKNWVVNGTPDEIEQRITNWRSGYRPAVAVGIGLSIALSVLSKSALPTIFAAGAAFVMLNMYEGALPPERRLQLSDWPTLLLTSEAPQRALTQVNVPALPANSPGL